jgi:hypothetical protein
MRFVGDPAGGPARPGEPSEPLEWCIQSRLLRAHCSSICSAVSLHKVNVVAAAVLVAAPALAGQ